MTFIKPSDRISAIKPYFFASLNQKINELKAKKKDVIRLDMGSPDLARVNFIIESLIESARRPDTHGYSPMGGTASFRQAICTYYMRRFGVDLDVKTEVVGLIGSKEGLFTLSQVLLNPSDVSLVPDPGYPVYTAGSLIAGGEVYYVPLLKKNHFLPDLDAIPVEMARRAKILWLNYPNNPTGAVASLEFFEKAIAFGRKYEVVIAHDAPYTDVCFDGYIAPSMMQIPGAKEVAVEFNSLSKAFNMAGWRLGMAVGNPQVIGYLSTYKSQMDSAQFEPVFQAGVAALTGDQDWTIERNKVYRERRDICLEGLRSVGFQVDTPPAAIYIWAHLPEGFEDDLVFCDRLLTDTGVSITPGTVYGQNGQGYVRISLVIPTDRIKEAMDRMVAWMDRP